MKRIHVESTGIQSIGFDKKTNTLEIEFIGGGTYQYFNVPKRIYNSFIDAESKGQFFSFAIREKYKFEKV